MLPGNIIENAARVAAFQRGIGCSIVFWLALFRIFAVGSRLAKAEGTHKDYDASIR
jgi:hypothetical protein